MNQHPQGRAKEFRAQGFDPNKNLVSPGGKNLVVTQNNLIKIANTISGVYKRKLGDDEIRNLNSYIGGYPVKLVAGLTLPEQIKTVADDFIAAEKIYNSKITSRGVIDVANYEYVTDYMKKVLNSGGDNSIYNDDSLSVPTSDNFSEKTVFASLDNQNQSEKFDDKSTVSQILYQMFGGKSIIELMNQGSRTFSNYQSLVLRRHIINFDSRNRSLRDDAGTSPFTDYEFSLSFATATGTQGVIRLQNILQDIVRLEIREFWFPVSNLINSKSIALYKTIKVFIKELSASAVQYDLINFPDSKKTANFYHFELDVKQIVAGRALLVPNATGYAFNVEIKRLEKITFQFFDPFYLITNLPDRLLVSFGSATLFTATFRNTPIGEPTLLNIGDIVYFNLDITAYSGVALTQAQALNDIQGHTVIGLPTPGEFTINLTVTSIPSWPDEIQLFVGSRRVTFEMQALSVPDGRS